VARRGASAASESGAADNVWSREKHFVTGHDTRKLQVENRKSFPGEGVKGRRVATRGRRGIRSDGMAAGPQHSDRLAHFGEPTVLGVVGEFEEEFAVRRTGREVE